VLEHERNRRGGLGVGEVGDDDVGAAPGRGDLLGHLLELGLGAGRDDDVGTGFRECHGDRRAEAATRPGGPDSIVEPKSVQNHMCLSSLAGRHRNKAFPIEVPLSETGSSLSQSCQWGRLASNVCSMNSTTPA
jgi:hypothetical protein